MIAVCAEKHYDEEEDQPAASYHHYAEHIEGEGYRRDGFVNRVEISVAEIAEGVFQAVGCKGHCGGIAVAPRCVIVAQILLTLFANGYAVGIRYGVYSVALRCNADAVYYICHAGYEGVRVMRGKDAQAVRYRNIKQILAFVVVPFLLGLGTPTATMDCCLLP